MSEVAIKETAIEKLVGLSDEEVQKVLIFMAGLDAGIRINESKLSERNEKRCGRQEKPEGDKLT